MFPEKRKRHKHSHKRLFFALLLLVPMLLSFRHIELGLIGDSLALMVLISAAIYLVYQFIAWLISHSWS